MTTFTARHMLDWRDAEDRFGRLVDAFLAGVPAPDVGIVTAPLVSRARTEADRLMELALFRPDVPV
jgi:hypothetical protein